MKKFIIVFCFSVVCASTFAQQYDAVDKYWLPQECSFNLQDASLRFAANTSKNVTLGEMFDVLFAGKNLELTKMSLLSKSKVTTVEVADEIRGFDLLSPVKIVSGGDMRFDMADYMIAVEGTNAGKQFGDILIYVCNASGAAGKSMYRNVTVLSDLWGKAGSYSTKNFLVAYDYQNRADAEKKFRDICAPMLAKQNESAEGFSEQEYAILDNRNASLLYNHGRDYTEFDQNRDAIAAFGGAYRRLCAELKTKGYGDVEKKRFSMILASEIAANYIKIGKQEQAARYLYHAQNMARELNEYKYAIEYVKSLNDYERGVFASKLAAEMKNKGLDISDAVTYKTMNGIK
ncbi:MAG: hypothetical protein J6T48_05585 [Bacteroidales bacterium]|nr:hypothetical protein [Bacteroidales bacterium]